MSWWPYVLAVLGIFTVVTMWAVLVTEGCRKIKLQYYAFKLASSSRSSHILYSILLLFSFFFFAHLMRDMVLRNFNTFSLSQPFFQEPFDLS